MTTATHTPTEQVVLHVFAKLVLSPEVTAAVATLFENLPVPAAYLTVATTALLAQPGRFDGRPASPKQVSFARSLARSFPEVATALEGEDAVRTMGAVSLLIDGMKAAERSAPTSAVTEVPEGFHRLGDEFFKVQKSQTGNLYAKVWADGGWDYVGRGPLARLSDDTLATLEEAEAFGKLYGMCGICGRTLTDEESIARGIGPICATKF